MIEHWLYKVLEVDRDGFIVDPGLAVPTATSLGSIHDMGREGWELVSLWPKGDATATVIFKRRFDEVVKPS